MKRYCSHCGKELNKSEKPKNVFCNIICKGLWQKENLKGKNNPNYGNEYSDEYRQMRSNLSKKQMEDEEQRFLAGTANRGKTLSKEVRQNMSDGKKGHIGVVHTTDTKKQIGIKSAEKFTDAYKAKIRKQNYDSGFWIDPALKDDYKLYCEFSNWNQRMFDIVKDGLAILNKYGVFHMKKNSKGVVRDHIYGRKMGFANGVFPEILRHPANCQIILHADNVSKNFKKKTIKDSDITLADLFQKIMNWTNEWHEQLLCIELINMYECGERYNKMTYIQKNM